jgi:hypothetical protein
MAPFGEVIVVNVTVSAKFLRQIETTLGGDAGWSLHGSAVASEILF